MEQKREETRFSTVTGGIYAIRKRITITTGMDSWSYIGTAPQGGLGYSEYPHLALDSLVEWVLSMMGSSFTEGPKISRKFNQGRLLPD